MSERSLGPSETGSASAADAGIGGDTVLAPLVVVTGASSGIGLELARVFAEKGFDLLLCAEDSKIDDAVDELATGTPGRRSDGGSSTRTFSYWRPQPGWASTAASANEYSSAWMPNSPKLMTKAGF